jgi:hypothetical protein
MQEDPRRAKKTVVCAVEKYISFPFKMGNTASPLT